MIFMDRGRRAGSGRFTRLKVHLFFAGAAVLLAGMALQRDALVLFAIAILAVGFVLRFFDREPAREYAEEVEEDESVDDADGDADDGDPPPDRPPPGVEDEGRREDRRTS
jgi:hypothetical protein